MRTVIGKPFFLSSNGCPSSKRTEFIAILSSPSASPEYHSALSYFVLRDVGPICQGNVTPSYVEGSIEDCELLVCVLFYSMDAPLPISAKELIRNEEGVQLYGFSSCFDMRMVSKGRDDSLYIDVICGNPIGMV